MNIKKEQKPKRTAAMKLKQNTTNCFQRGCQHACLSIVTPTYTLCH